VPEITIAALYRAIPSARRRITGSRVAGLPKAIGCGERQELADLGLMYAGRPPIRLKFRSCPKAEVRAAV
jgi:hypothetical protein